MVSEEIYKLVAQGICPVCRKHIKEHTPQQRQSCKKEFFRSENLRGIIMTDTVTGEQRKLPLDVFSMKRPDK